MKYIVTRSFQYKSVTPKGKILDLTEADLKNTFLASHVEPLEQDAKPVATPTYFGNGTPKTANRETPAAVATDAADDMSVGQLRVKLAKLGVHYSNKMSQTELAALYRQAQEAVAGSPATANRPLL